VRILAFEPDPDACRDVEAFGAGLRARLGTRGHAVKHRSNTGQTLVKHRSNTGQTLVKHWSNTGQIQVKYWSNTGQGGERSAGPARRGQQGGSWPHGQNNRQMELVKYWSNDPAV
jgi:hypothetical protein